MLDKDPLAAQFVGGTVYQAFLSALKYHRWSSPVNGTVEKVTAIPGTYYAESPEMGFTNPKGPDSSGPNLSQGYITSIAARLIMYIRADNPKIGLIVFVAVGMAEVSTCEATVRAGDRIRKGDELGMFHFGGSTHCLLFGPDTKVTFAPECNKPGSDVELNSPIATVE
ncbi:hypothetical protein FRC12_010900 [Ceratobasidium sp. 428]|nr:hypothetical protein FRC09_003430 [Ceratobasidium sp. 395]KAG8790820.1 hypothetical protein FRC12_010900 [Ceratobasidium sp. 428]